MRSPHALANVATVAALARVRANVAKPPRSGERGYDFETSYDFETTSRQNEGTHPMQRIGWVPISRSLNRSLPEKSDLGSLHQKHPVVRQHFLNRRLEPHGQRSFRPSFSSSSLSPWTTRTPCLTCVSDGKPFRRLLVVSKKRQIVEVV